jgi:hypothetical protein
MKQKYFDFSKIDWKKSTGEKRNLFTTISRYSIPGSGSFVLRAPRPRRLLRPYRRRSQLAGLANEHCFAALILQADSLDIVQQVRL